jgi:hypothetical protein
VTSRIRKTCIIGEEAFLTAGSQTFTTWNDLNQPAHGVTDLELIVRRHATHPVDNVRVIPFVNLVRKRMP